MAKLWIDSDNRNQLSLHRRPPGSVASCMSCCNLRSSIAASIPASREAANCVLELTCVIYFRWSTQRTVWYIIARLKLLTIICGSSVTGNIALVKRRDDGT